MVASGGRMGKGIVREFGGEWIHVYMWLSPFAVHPKLSNIVISYTLI